MLGTSSGMPCHLKFRGRGCTRVRCFTKHNPECAAQAFVEAVHAGDIFWHAMPFNTQVEMFDGPLLQYAVEMTHELDAKFGQKPKHTMSQVVPAPAHQATTIWWGPKVLARKDALLVLRHPSAPAGTILRVSNLVQGFRVNMLPLSVALHPEDRHKACGDYGRGR